MRSLQWYKRGAAYQKGEGWVKSGEELMKPFTVISVLYIVLYVMLVKGEGCF